MVIGCGLLIQNKGSFLFKENLAFLLEDTVIMPIVFSVGSLPCHLSGNNRAKLISTSCNKVYQFSTFSIIQPRNHNQFKFHQDFTKNFVGK